MYLYKKIIEAFNIDIDPIKIARRFSFKNQYEMYNYMGKEGYIWNSDIRNYERSNIPHKKVRDKKTKAIDDNFLLDKYIDLLEDLYRERETKLVDENLDYKDYSDQKISIEADEYKISFELAYKLYKYSKYKGVSISSILDECIKKYFESMHTDIF